jgi:hypothetical protein
MARVIEIYKGIPILTKISVKYEFSRLLAEITHK